MENPATWNRATHVISDAIGEYSLQVSAGYPVCFFENVSGYYLLECAEPL